MIYSELCLCFNFYFQAFICKEPIFYKSVTTAISQKMIHHFLKIQVSAGADETLRLWKCFLPDPNKKKLMAKSLNAGSSILRAGIR